MRISLRSMLIAGVSTLAVSSIALAPVHAIPYERAATSSAPVHLTAAVKPLPRPDMSSALAEISQIADELNMSPAAADVAAQNAASDFVTWLYSGIIEWTDYFALELAPYVLQFLPLGWVITNQIYAIYPPVIDFTDSVVFDLINPVLNDPLNLEVWANGIGAVAYTGVASLINVAINEINLVIDYFLSWLPPLPPIPPWPPFPVSAETEPADLAGAQALLPNPIAGPVVAASGLAAGLAHGLVNLWYPPSDLIDGGVGLVSNVLGGFSWLPLVGVANFQLNEFWGLIEAEGDTVAGFANDLIGIAHDLVANTVTDGITPAFDDALWTTLQSVQVRGDAAADAVTNFALDQLQYLTGVWVPHTVHPEVDLPQGPPDTIRFSAPQVLRDVLGPLAGLIPSGTTAVPTSADTSPEATAAAIDSAADAADDADAAQLDHEPSSETETDASDQTADTDVAEPVTSVTSVTRGDREERAEARRQAKADRADGHSRQDDESEDGSQEDESPQGKASASTDADDTEKADAEPAKSEQKGAAEKSDAPADAA